MPKKYLIGTVLWLDFEACWPSHCLLSARRSRCFRRQAIGLPYWQVGGRYTISNLVGGE